MVTGVVTLALLAQTFMFWMLLGLHADQVRTRLLVSGVALASALREVSASKAGLSSRVEPMLSPQILRESDYCVAVYDGRGRMLYQHDCDESAAPLSLSRSLQQRARKRMGAPAFVEVARLASPTSLVFALPITDAAQGAGFITLYETKRSDELKALRAESWFLASMIVTGLVLLSALLATYAVVRAIRAMIQRSQIVVRRIADGELDKRLQWAGDDEVGILVQDFNRMADRIQALVSALQKDNEGRRVMFAALSHELNTPLTSALGCLESLQLPEIADTPARRERYVLVAYEQTMALAAVVEDLDTLSRLDVGDLPMHKHLLSLSCLAQREATAMANRAEAAGVQILVCAADDDTIQMDPQRIGQVLRNLLDNAIRYAPRDSSVEVAVMVKVKAVIVTVTDHGPGMLPEMKARVGEWLLRADPSRTRRTGGRGLGLAIAKRLIEAHGGNLTVASGLGRGTTIRCSLPRAH